MNPKEIASLANQTLEHGVAILTPKDRREGLDRLQMILDAEAKGVIRMTRDEVDRIVSLRQFIKNNS